ncbi:hypothetical protein TWF718_007120 [Orbilia javanica]|uniref:Exonuclease domain-containing protein n=1 Tax=Orbilia javanica TaxID=47235 RepID=A0AAN8N2D5_9PEZI
MDPVNINVSQDQVETLQMLLGIDGSSEAPPPDSDRQDAIIVAIDVENAPRITKDDSPETVNAQIGFAILDTKDLSNSTAPADIKTYNFVMGNLEYYRRVSPDLLFGESFNLTKKEITQKIIDLIPKSRNIVLVGHDIKADLRAGHALHRLLTLFGIPFRNLHCAGNDANFTLRLLLLLAIHPLENKCLSACQEEMLTKLRQISHAPLPRLNPHSSNLTVDLRWQARRERRKRKVQARLQTLRERLEM